MCVAVVSRSFTEPRGRKTCATQPYSADNSRFDVVTATYLLLAVLQPLPEVLRHLLHVPRRRFRVVGSAEVVETTLDLVLQAVDLVTDVRESAFGGREALEGTASVVVQR